MTATYNEFMILGSLSEGDAWVELSHSPSASLRTKQLVRLKKGKKNDSLQGLSASTILTTSFLDIHHLRVFGERMGNSMR